MTNVGRRGILGSIAALFAAPRISIGRHELRKPDPGMEQHGNVSYMLEDEETFVTFPVYRSRTHFGEEVLVADPHAGSIDKLRIVKKETK